MSEFKIIPLGQIAPDPNQPRKFYDEAAMEELVASVKEKGVIQAILIRPTPEGRNISQPYMLVCGERRYRASWTAGIADIPAVIREMSDEEALELQVIENLQRKDVHPMEEAVSFKSMLDNPNRKYTVEEIAAKVGKTAYFVKQRLTFTGLTEGWQKIFYANKVKTNMAFRIAQLAAADQERLFKSEVPRLAEALKDPIFFVEIGDYQINNLRRELDKAPFDVKDPKLNPKMGACTGCPFNTAVASLFPEDAQNPICNFATCFQEKSDKAFKGHLADVLQDPTVVLIRTNGWMDSDEKKKLEKLCQGHKVHQNHDEYSIDYSPAKSAIESGKLLKGFVVAGNNKGQIVWVSRQQRSTGRSSGGPKPADKIKEGKAKVEDVQAEITRIQEREKRSKELDLEKTHKIMLEQMQDNAVFKAPGHPWQVGKDRGLLVFLLLDTAGYSCIDTIRKKVKLPPSPAYNVRKYQQDYFEKLGNITEDELAFILRTIIRSKWGSTNVQGISTSATTMRIIAEYAGVDVTAIEAEQAEKARKRSEKVDKRLQELKDLKTLLTKQAAEKTEKKKGKEGSAKINLKHKAVKVTGKKAAAEA